MLTTIILATFANSISAALLRHPQTAMVQGQSTVKLSSKFVKAVDDGVDSLVGEDSPSNSQVNMGNVIKSGVAAVDLDEVMKEAQPNQNIVHMLAQSKSLQTPKLNEKDVKEAVVTLNKMIFKAQIRLDAKSLECRTFKEKNRQTMSQVVTDLNRLGSSLANLERTKITTSAKKESAALASQQLLEEQFSQKTAYEEERGQDTVTLGERTSDLRVSEFILKLSKCPTSLMQQDQAVSSRGLTVCNGTDGKASYRFNDARIENSKNGLSMQGKELLDFALHRMELSSDTMEKDATMKAAGLAMGASMSERDDGDDSTDSFLQQESTTTTSGLAPTAFPAVTFPPLTEPRSPEKQATRCRDAVPDCGLLYDTFALLWGGMKDLVDETTQKIAGDDAAWKTLNEGFNAQLESLSTEMGDLSALFAEATSDAIADTEAQTAKQRQQKQLEAIYQETMAECKETLRQILYTDICGTIKVRNQLIESTLKITDVVDCAVTEWVDGACSVPCNAGATGGIRHLEREVVVGASLYGAACPALNASMKCNQIECPVDCLLTDWSEYSRCSKECGGGVQTRTRGKLTLPLNGGQSCTALQETQPCNTGSCDRDCTLTPWSQYSACSQACDGGKMTKTKSVVIKSRAEGECPAPKSWKRFWRTGCNEHPCMGDEVCTSTMDIVLAIDSSGSLTQKGFDILKAFASEFVGRIHSNARIAVVQFGNGHLDEHKVVADAILSLPLTASMSKVNDTIKALKYQKGFTNMAQAFKKANEVLKRASRSEAETELIMITDGKPSFQLQTGQALKELKQSVRVVMVHVKEFPSKQDIKLMKSYSSSPDSENYIFIPGKKQLKLNYEKFAQKLLVQTCPMAVSVMMNRTLMEPGLVKL